MVEAFRQSGNKPEWMILAVVPVLPPDLRPLVPLEGGRFATSDLNDLYRRVINRNNRLKKLMEIRAPEVILRNEKRMLQESVDALFDNGRRSRAVRGQGNRPLKSLSDMLKGKQGRFRQNLLGKRVDYSGRSVIVVGPELKLHQCGLPKTMALELFKPFIIKNLEDRGFVSTVKSAKRFVERESPEVWEILGRIIKGHPVLLNRAPTLHRLGIQAFEPVLVEGKAIRIHPLVCAAFNADFDGDQMAVHVPLGFEAQIESMQLMLSAKNILSPASGRPAGHAQPGHRARRPLPHQGGRAARGAREAAPLRGRPGSARGLRPRLRRAARAHRAAGGRQDPGDHPGAGALQRHPAARARLREREHGQEDPGAAGGQVLPPLRTAEDGRLPRRSQEPGFHLRHPGGDQHLHRRHPDSGRRRASSSPRPRRRPTRSARSYRTGVITEGERYNRIIDTWTRVTSDVEDATFAGLAEDQLGFNPIFMMADSGSRGSKEQIRQLAGMRGLMAKPQKKITGGMGEIIESPVIRNFKEGLTVLEYFISTHGARKGLADTALKTADAGYLTRRLVGRGPGRDHQRG